MHLATFSINARCPRTGMLGVAVASRFLAVGALCPFAGAGVGAIATQALVNPLLGTRGLELLEQGYSSSEALAKLLAQDEGREYRQITIVDRAGRSAAFTGSETVGWSGHRNGPDYAVAGNMLVGPKVIDSMAESFEGSAGQSLPERLLLALEAGQAAGGDKRGKQSAALYVVENEEYPYLDLRVDDHPDPTVELRRLLTLADQLWGQFRGLLPTRANPSGLTDPGIIQAIRARNDAILRGQER